MALPYCTPIVPSYFSFDLHLSIALALVLHFDGSMRMILLATCLGAGPSGVELTCNKAIYVLELVSNHFLIVCFMNLIYASTCSLLDGSMRMILLALC